MIVMNVKMPQSCGDCLFRFADVCMPVMGGSHTNRLSDFSNRPKWCPIVDEIKEGDKDDQD